MKKAAFIAGAVGCSLIPIGIWFKLMHWPGASILLSLGIFAFSCVFVPLIAIYLYNKEK